MLLNQLKIEEVYDFVYLNLDELVVENDLNQTKINIRRFVINLDIVLTETYEYYNQLIPIEESQFWKHFLSNFTNPKYAQISKLLTGGIAIADVGAFALTTGGFGSYIMTLFGASSIIGGLMPMLLLVVGFGLYDYIKHSDSLNMVRMIRNAEKISLILKTRIASNLEKTFGNIMEKQCGHFEKDKKGRFDCSARLFIKVFNNEVVFKIVPAYFKFLVDSNENVSGIKTARNLANVKSKANPELSKLFHKFYTSYIETLSNLIKQDKTLVTSSISNLNILISNLERKNA